jgi:uncharacterized protein (TIGR01777 family)
LRGKQREIRLWTNANEETTEQLIEVENGTMESYLNVGILILSKDGVSPMKILVSGSHGLVGSALISSLKRDGHEVFALVRRAPRTESEVEWYPDRGSLALSRLEQMNAVVHLGGESIVAGRWTEEKKQRIRDSRVKGTKLLAEALANMKAAPQTFMCASAIGFYGDRGNEILTEESGPGNDFLASVCAEWEQATKAAAEQGIRVVNLRFGIILSGKGGALTKMLPPFRLGIGGRVGSGKQYMSWIALDDVIGAIKFALTSDALRGPVNFVAPNPVTNAVFTKALGRALSRPTIFPVPAIALRLFLGELADGLLASQRVEPRRLSEAQYRFQHSQLESALRRALQ